MNIVICKGDMYHNIKLVKKGELEEIDRGWGEGGRVGVESHSPIRTSVIKNLIQTLLHSRT